ncbi:MAG: hypothetical protein R3D62_12975 [Xanthobacteraceae bacterium]
MSFAKIALFAFGFATIIAAGAVNANAASYGGRSYDNWSSSAGWHGSSAEESLFQRAKGNPQGY